jgi:hypothetical protein
VDGALSGLRDSDCGLRKSAAGRSSERNEKLSLRSPKWPTAQRLGMTAVHEPRNPQSAIRNPTSNPQSAIRNPTSNPQSAIRKSELRRQKWTWQKS